MSVVRESRMRSPLSMIANITIAGESRIILISSVRSCDWSRQLHDGWESNVVLLLINLSIQINFLCCLLYAPYSIQPSWSV
jgi:hypothetical protein